MCHDRSDVWSANKNEALHASADQKNVVFSKRDTTTSDRHAPLRVQVLIPTALSKQAPGRGVQILMSTATRACVNRVGEYDSY